MLHRWVWVFACAFTGPLVLHPSSVRACSPQCGGDILPRGTDEAPAHLPANGAFVRVQGGYPPSEVTMSRTRAGVTEVRSLGMSRWEPVALPEVAPGDHVVVSFTNGCNSTVVTSVIDVTPVAPLPTTLGVVEVSASHNQPVAVWDNRGACTSDLASTVAPYTVALDPSIAPWADAIELTPMLDGSPWSEVSDVRVAPHFIFARCETPLPSQVDLRDATLGEHTLRIDGSIRGLNVTLASNTETLALQCASSSGASCSAHAPAQPSSKFAVLSILAATTLLARRRLLTIRQ